MPGEVVIRVKNLSKEFTMAEGGVFTALKDVSFDIERGDVVSIIGNNGSGKSTLLRILSNITKPTSGEVLLYGSSTSILDVGGNFHPDLTGRQNVDLQLKLAKKDKAALEKLTAEILEFSEIGNFFDQPVKHYSSGMFLRLAFSMAFHIASDILILDEVLSVGDEGFRLKCQELLKKFAASGKTIVFVSHNRQEILELSNKCIWLEKGQVRKRGFSTDLLGEYFANHKENFERKKQVIVVDDNFDPSRREGVINMEWDEISAPQNEYVSVREVRVISAQGREKLYSSDEIIIKFSLNKKVKGTKIGAFFFLQDVFYQPVMAGHILDNIEGRDITAPTDDFLGMVEVSCTIPGRFLIPGKYYLQLRFGMEENEWNMQSRELLRFFEKLSIVVYPSPDYVDMVGDMSKGSVRPKLNWKLELKA
jgi:ABC-type polysaccharide/polyol phosphate transport system ATPase subunit